MENEFFNFEPSEFQVLEDIEFDETIQRPEKVRFFTLEEQTVDAFERMLPKGRVTKYQIRELEKEVDRLKDLYDSYVVVTADDYKLREPEYQKRLSWVYPVYTDKDYRGYDFNSSWRPLVENVNQPNYYQRMIAALPKPFADSGEGAAYPITQPIEFLTAEGQAPRRGLPDYELTRTQRHDNGSISILRVPVAATSDQVKFSGYYLAKRPLDIPNPLEEHPFLKANEPTFVETTELLSEVAPSLDAVLTHAVPVTRDPYGEAMPYLKLYDIRLQDIPWSSWKTKFPPVESIETQEEIVIEFPKAQELRPSDKIIEEYRANYELGVSPRKWLMDQVDSGGLVITMLLSKAIENGSVGAIPGIDLPVPGYPATTIEECKLMDRTFPEFVVQGLLRVTRKKVGKEEVEEINCVPLEFVKQERSRLGYLNRLPWKESTGNELLDAYRKRLAVMHPIQTIAGKFVQDAMIPGKPESPMRKEVLLIQNDKHRFAEDKVRDLQDLLKGSTTLTNNIYSDMEGSFVLCAHTLAVLSGDFAADKRAFYDKWTSTDDGYRVCKFCGEQVSMVDFVNQVEFDEDGYVMNRTDSLEEKAFRAESIAGFTTGLRALEPLFNLDNPMDSTAFLLMSILQVLPTAEAVVSMLTFGRAFLIKQYGNKDSEDIKKIKGIVGIIMVILLLQSHVPRLLPRRSFGPRPLKLDGYPRDEKEPGEYSILDSMMMVIRKTFEAYPTSFRGPSQQVIRAILNKPGDVKKNITILLNKVFLVDKDVRGLLDRAPPPDKVEEPKTLIPVILPAPTEFDKITGFAQCPSARPILSAGEPPKVVQAFVPLRNGIQADRFMTQVPPSLSVRVAQELIAKAVIQNMFKKKSTLLPVRDGYRTNIALASRLADMFLLPQPILRSLDPNQKPDELRDISKGILYEILNQIQADPVKRAELEVRKTKDVTLYALLSDFKEEKANVNRLRAQERLRFVDEMARRSDQEREILGELLKIGVAPYIITNRDREAFARQAQQLVDLSRIDQEVLDQEVGVGQPMDVYDQGDMPIQGNEEGNYGDYYAQPGNDGRDHEQPTFWDDDNPPI